MKRLLLVLIGFALFIVRLPASLQGFRNLDKYEGRQITISGRISSQINLQGNSQSFYLGLIQVRTQLYPAYEYGDKLAISGTLQRKVINPYYSRFSLIYPSIERVAAGNNIFIGLKNKLESWFSRILPEPESSLLAGIVLGSKRGLPQDFWQALQKTGTLHIVVASGYNVTIVMGVTISLLAGLVKRWQAITLGIAAVMIYSFMAGWEPAIVRAAVMGSLAYFGQALGKLSDGLHLLVLAVMVMLVYNPLFIWDIGFQLSVMATFGLILICPRLPRLPQGVGESLAAQIMVWPILVYNFGQMSVFGIVVNGLILWLVPYIMALSLLPWLAYLPLHLMVLVVNWFGRFDWMSWQVSPAAAGWWWILGYYLVVTYVVTRKKN
ncbi:ComEC/Rec2 family competence protein [Patescibacteria group bacterium]|nr:ComEC/Rec2 family competence protein [Patescibacteria group bacterium]